MNEIKLTPEGRRVTIRTVAADAGVSVAAVSKVLRNAYGVSDSLRQRVLVSINRLGYRPSVAARGMRGQTYTIGILLVEIANPFIPLIIDGVNAVLETSPYKALMGMGRSATTIEASLIESMIDNRLDGLILVAPRMMGETLAKFARQIPIVAIGHHESSSMEFDTVNGDDLRGGALVVEALVKRGYTDIAMIGNEDADATVANVIYQREIGFRAAMQSAGLGDLARILYFPQRDKELMASINAFIHMPDRPRAVFVWSDLVAVPLLNAAKIAGIRVPEDLAIVGYDNTGVAALPLIDLSSIDQAGAELGAQATRVLMDRIGGRADPVHILLTPRLVVRGSLGS